MNADNDRAESADEGFSKKVKDRIQRFERSQEIIQFSGFNAASSGLSERRVSPVDPPDTRFLESRRNYKPTMSIPGERAEPKDKERKTSFLSVFKIRRQKSGKDYAQNSDYEYESDDPFSTRKEPPGNSTNPVRSRIETLNLDTAKNDSQKTGRLQQMKTKFQLKMTLPNKPDVNLNIDSASDRKAAQSRRQTISHSTKVDPPVSRHGAGSPMQRRFPASKRIEAANREWSESENREQATLDLKTEPLKPSDSDSRALRMRKSLPLHLTLDDDSSNCSSQNEYDDSGSLSARQPHDEGPSDPVSGYKSTDLNVKPQYDVKVSDPSPRTTRKEKSKPFANIFGKPGRSKVTTDPRNSVGSALDPKMVRDKNIFQALLHRRLSSKQTYNDDETPDHVVNPLYSPAKPFKANLTRHASQQLLSSKSADGTRRPENAADDDFTSPTRSSFGPETLNTSFDGAVFVLQKKAASLPDLLNCSDNISESSVPNQSEKSGGAAPKTTYAMHVKTEIRKRLSSLSDHKGATGNAGATATHDNPDSQFDEEATKGRPAPPLESSFLQRKQQSGVNGDRNILPSVIMFGRKLDVKKSAQKVLDPKKDNLARLKHLRSILENYDITEAKVFFEQHYSVVYFLFHEGFTNAEMNLGQRVNKAHREELDFMLFVLEQVLTLLPEMIHKRWQLHSIGRILKKLLHSGNPLKVRREGVRLFLMWYGILMDNATEECHRIFRSIVPVLSTSSDNFEADSSHGKMFSNSRIMPPDVCPLLPSQVGEKKLPDDVSKWLLEGLMDYMVSEVRKIQWDDRESFECCFRFLFEKFRDYYLPEIFPDLNRSNSIYEPCLDLPGIERAACTSKSRALCQDTVVKWLTDYTLALTISLPTSNGVCADKGEMTGETDRDHPREFDHQISQSVASTLSTPSSTLEDNSRQSSPLKNRHSLEDHEMVQRVLYSSRDNVDVVHEVFRQAFLCPQSTIVRRVLLVYRSWFQVNLPDLKPIFMQERLPALRCSTALDVKDSNRRQTLPYSASGQPSFQSERNESTVDVIPRVDIRVGLQRVVQVFITNSAHLFLIESRSEQWITIEEWVDACKKVLSMYRYIVTNILMDHSTWEQLLSVLLKMTSVTLSVDPPVHAEESLNGRLAEPLFKTLISSWIKANLSIYVSEELWEKFIKILSSLTNWIQLIREWSKTMDMLTRVLARFIYAIDLRDLPLDKLSEQKVKKLRGARNGQTDNHERSLSRHWTKQIMDDENLKQQIQQQQQLLHQLKSSEPSSVPVTTSLQSFTSSLQSDASGVRIQHDSARKRSRSGELSLVHQSRIEIDSESDLQPNADCSGESRLTRSSSDSSMLTDQNKTIDSDVCISITDNDNNQELVAAEEDNVSRAYDEQNSPKPNEENCELDFIRRYRQLSSTSFTSIDSHQYQAMASCSSDNSSFCLEQSSFSDRSDMEVLIHASDSGSASSHGIRRSKNRLAQESRSLSSQVEEDEANEEEDEVVEDEEMDRLNVGAVLRRTAEDSLGDEYSVQSFDDRQVKGENDGENVTDLNIDGSKSKEKLSLMVGGDVSGWTPDAAVALWSRILGCLGNINEIKSASMHAQVYEYFCELLDTFVKIRENQGVTKDNQLTPPEPIFVPPVLLLSPWFFEALNLPDNYKQGKLKAYQLLCAGTLRRHDVEPSSDHLSRFYLMLHLGLTHSTQDVTNVLIRSCNAKFFSLPLPGSMLMILDFIHAAKMVLAQPTDACDVPRAEAMSLLGSLLCFPNHFHEIPVLDPNSEELSVITCTDVKEFKDQILNVLLKHTRTEPPGLSRWIGFSCLGIYLCEELCSSQILHPKFKDALNILLSALRLNDKAACQTVTHVLTMLCDHMSLLLLKLPEILPRVVKDMTIAITLQLTAVEKGTSAESRKIASQILVSTMFALLEWCMNLPTSVLLMTPGAGDRSLLHQVFDVLNMVVNGSTTSVLVSTRQVRSADVPDDKRLSLPPFFSQSVPSTPNTAAEFSTDAYGGGQKQQRQETRISASAHHLKDDGDHDTCGIKLAAKTIMLHLINYLYHFPMAENGASQMNSEVQEQDDGTLEEVVHGELQSQLLTSANTQFFVINNTTVMSFVEIPAQQTNEPECDGLSKEKTICRVIVRDPSGKHSWDSVILYGSQQCRSISCHIDPPVRLHIDEDEDLNEQEDSRRCRRSSDDSVQERNSCLAYDPSVSAPMDSDVLDLMLQHLSASSPECLLYPDENLNMAFHTPIQLSSEVESRAMEALVGQQLDERKHIKANDCDNCMASKPALPMDNCDTVSPFRLCRLFFSQWGYLASEKRKQVDLLHKSEKLFRELKNLDNQRCRETHKIAVIYVGPGQEDKVSILKNSAGSRAFEEFVAALGWQVDLQSHAGFLGGLQRNQTTGSSAPYYATSTKEVIFHVSTHMPSHSEEDQLRKLRHLGNDEVHIIWSEHKRDYRYGIIPTDFADVLIIIYPLENGLFRIQIIQRPEVPYFGPLFDGAIIDFQALPGLVRSTAINAGQMLRTQKPYYQTYYEERMRNIDTIVQRYKKLTAFEVFSSQIFDPSQSIGDNDLTPPPIVMNNGQPQMLKKVSKDDHHIISVPRKLSLVPGKTKKLKKIQSAITPPKSPQF